MPSQSEEDVIEFARRLKVLAETRKYNKLELYHPYEKQLAFHAAGADYLERAFIAGNRLGKTESGGAEVAYHATGLYPEWWTGKRFTSPTIGWVGAETGVAVTLTVQEKLMGPAGVVAAQGTGMLPKHLIVDTSLARGVTDMYDTIQVRHVSGGISTIKFMTYEMGRSKWQGAMVDYIWFDEEPPMDVYIEGVTRVFTRKGLVLCTFTPLKGRSNVVLRYMDEPSPDRTFFTMTIYEAGHFTPEEREKIIATWPVHERKARAEGVPMMGHGVIYSAPEEQVICQPREVPRFFKVIVGLDIGIDHPTAAVWLAYDADTDTIYVYNEYRANDVKVSVHASAIRHRGPGIPIAWPHDAARRDAGSGDQIAKQYRAEGLNMLSSHATWSDGGNSVEAGIMEIQNREEQGRLKYFNNCQLILEERRWYHRSEKDGQIVKEKDDLLSAMRYAIMMLRYSRPLQDVGIRGKRRSSGSVAKGVEYNMFGGNY